MEETQVKKLKLNVKNIKSSLLGYNKKLRKLDVQKNKFTFSKEQKEKVFRKEKSIEEPQRIRSALGTIKNTLLSGPLSILDKFKEFFGLILLGIVVNNLPKIVGELQKVLKSIGDFFDRNPWIMNVLKFTFDVIGKGLTGLLQLIKDVSPYIGGSFKFALDSIRSAGKKIDELNTLFSEFDKSLKDYAKSLNLFGSPSKDLGGKTSFDAGGGQASVNEGKTIEQVQKEGLENLFKAGGGQAAVDQGKTRTEVIEQGTIASKPQPKKKPDQKLASGGTIKPPSTGSTFRNPSLLGTSGRPETRKSMVESGTPFARPGGTAKGRKAIQTINYFDYFNKNNQVGEDVAKVNTENNNLFEEMIKKFDEVRLLRLKVGDEEDDGDQRPGAGDGDGDGGDGDGGGGGGGQFTGTAADIPPEGKALLDAIAGAEAGGYNARYPSKTFNNGYKDHPRIRERTPWGTYSDAAGRYQFMSSTWDAYKPAKAFTPENQDIAAWKLAIAVYGYGENGILKDLRKDPMKVAAKLRGTWPSLPGGSQTNVHTSGFLKRYEASVKKYNEQLTIPPILRGGSLPPLPPTGTYPGQHYGAYRKGRGYDHAGVDFDINGNEKFYSRIGGVVRKVGVAVGYGNYVDIYNSELKVVERIAEGARVLVRKGQSIIPGQAIVQGETRTGVIHYEIRTDGGGFGMAGTVNPIQYLSRISKKQNQQQAARPPSPSPSQPKAEKPKPPQAAAKPTIVNIFSLTREQFSNTLKNIKVGDKIVISGIGSIQGGSTGIGPFQKLKIKYYDPKGKEITLDELKERIVEYKKQQALKGPQKPGYGGSVAAIQRGVEIGEDPDSMVATNTVIIERQTILNNVVAQTIPFPVKSSGSSNYTPSVSKFKYQAQELA